MIELYLIGILFTALGVSNIYKPSKKIGLWGYRSERSITSIAAWNLAQQTSGRGLLTTGVFLICLSSLFNIMYFDPNTLPILAASACIFAVLDTIIQTEIVLANQSSNRI